MHQTAEGAHSRRTRSWLAVSILVVTVGALAIAIVPTIADAKKFRGTGKSDRITGTNKKDTIKLRGRNDVAKGRGGADRILGNGGNDTVMGQSGNDTLTGSAGKDRLVGGSGRDRLSGGAGKDSLNSVDRARDARVAGGPANNTCRIDDLDLPITSGCQRLRAVDGGGGGTGGGGAGGAGAGGDGPATALELDSGRGLVCDDSALACTFRLSGGGADDPVGTVTGEGGVTPGAGAGANASAGKWTAVGAYRCTSDGFLRVSFGAERLDVPVECV